MTRAEARRIRQPETRYTWKYVQNFRAFAKECNTLQTPLVRRVLRELERGAFRRQGKEPKP